MQILIYIFHKINISTSSSILSVLYKNQYAEIIDYSNDGLWFKIKINGVEGWSSGKYLNYIY
ncbi:SH3 domain-containing protein [Clostridium tetanomorphum]|uniref:SH3 domain-containing protein n=1 Tax=Clostridium tetanomorphum TaxID=1553 RepID=UPI001A9B2240|nr:SH3 domain-containing protein [Clostridium tetanomorphum]